jgi:hypothetical protein
MKENKWMRGIVKRVDRKILKGDKANVCGPASNFSLARDDQVD